MKDADKVIESLSSIIKVRRWKPRRLGTIFKYLKNYKLRDDTTLTA